MATQFPPSSPLLAHTEDDHNDDPFNSFSSTSKKLVISTPFNKPQKNESTEYPTPNPSSSAGNRDQSSPARTANAATNQTSQEYIPLRSEIELEHVNTSEESHRIVSTQKPLKVLLYPNEKVTLGRSSRCDYFMKSKFASRLHIRMQYNKADNELTVFCKGSNAVSVSFNKPEFGSIVKVEDDIYAFEQKPAELCDETEVFEELKVTKGEQFTMPYNPKLTLSVMDYSVVVDVTSDESETEDEIPVLKKRLSSIEPTEQMKEIEPDHLETPIDKQTKPVELPPLKQLTRSATPILKSSCSFGLETITKSAVLDRSKSVEPATSTIADTTTIATPHTHVRSSSLEIKQECVTALQSVSQNDLNKSHSSADKLRRTRKAEPGLSPVKKRPERLQPRQKIEAMNIEKVLTSIEDAESIQNVLTNHLAFSRLSQTPLKQLQAISASTQKLTREQMRAVLADTKHIGVIYRHGKDAAGKYLDEEYYYDLENDSDEERVGLVNTIKGGGLRNCRKTHKQYFWKKPGSAKK